MQQLELPQVVTKKRYRCKDNTNFCDENLALFKYMSPDELNSNEKYSPVKLCKNRNKYRSRNRAKEQKSEIGCHKRS